MGTHAYTLHMNLPVAPAVENENHQYSFYRGVLRNTFASGCAVLLMNIHEVGGVKPAHWRRLRGGGAHRTCRAGWWGAVECVLRDVVLLWRSAECGPAVRSDTAAGSPLTPPLPSLPPQDPRARRAAPSGASQSRKCGPLARSPPDKWLQRWYSSKLVNINPANAVCVWLLLWLWQRVVTVGEVSDRMTWTLPHAGSDVKLARWLPCTRNAMENMKWW